MSDQAPDIKVDSRRELRLTEVKQIIDRRYDEDEKLRAEWGVFQDYYENDYWNTDTLEEWDSRITANYFHSNIQQILPLMTDSRPIWYARSRFRFLQEIMVYWNEALGYQWFRQDMDMKLVMAYLDALVSETGFFQVHFDPDGGPDIDGSPLGDLRVDVVSPAHMVFPSGYDDLDDCPWVAKRKQFPLSWVRRNYPKAGRRVIPDKFATQANFNPDQMSDFQARNEWVTIYDQWIEGDRTEQYLKEQAAGNRASAGEVKGDHLKRGDYPNGRFVVFAGHGKGGPVSLEDAPSPYRNGLSGYVPVYDYRKQHQIWGTGECRQVRSLVLELNNQLQYMAHAMRNFARQNWEIDSSVQDADNVKNTFYKGGQFYVRRGGTENRSRAGIEPIQPQPPSEAHFAWVRSLIDMIEEISGVTELTKGVQEKRARQTAHEIETLLETGNTRTRQRVRNLEWSIKRVCTRMLDIMMQFYETDREYSVRLDNDVAFGNISNSRGFAERKIQEQVPQRGSRRKRKEAQDRADQDLAELLKAFPGEQDKVIAAFDVEVQTNSTLPLDKQSLANLALRLVQMKTIDPEAALDVLNFPNKKEIVARMAKREQAEFAAKSGGQNGQRPPQPGRRLSPENPIDASEGLRALGGGQ